MLANQCKEAAVMVNTKLVVVEFSSTPAIGIQYFLPDDGEIRNSIVTGLRVIYGNEISTSYNLGHALTVISGNQIKQFTITLKNSCDRELLVNIPGYTLVASNNNGRIRRLWRQVDLGKSYIKINDTTSFAAGQAILLEFHYIKR